MNSDTDREENQGSELVLVSSGAKMLRLKRLDFFRAASFEAMEYIRTITEDDE